MKPFQRLILVHYHEIGLKGHNRSSFEKKLLRNIASLSLGFPVVTIHRVSGRLLVFLKEGTDFQTACTCAETLSAIPGVARVSCALKCSREMPQIQQASLQCIADFGSFESFKVATRKNHTDFPLSSMELNCSLGDYLSQRFPHAKVQMKNPDLTLHVEIIQNAVFIYGLTQTGIGGLPVGSSGKVISLLSSGIDSPVATWKMARRGAICIGLHFSGRPQTNDASEYLVREIASILEKSGCIARLYIVPLGDYQRRIALSCPPPLRVILYRRLMFLTAQALAQIEGAKALVTGESLGQVASQTIENISVIDSAVQLPVFRPLIGTDKLEIISLAQSLHTFEISSRKAADCCTLFMPRQPETHASLSEVDNAQSEFPFDRWIPELLDSADTYDFNCASYHPPRINSFAVQSSEYS